jgi:hypothetical protein
MALKWVNNNTGNKIHLVIKVKNLLTVRSQYFENDFLGSQYKKV